MVNNSPIYKPNAKHQKQLLDFLIVGTCHSAYIRRFRSLLQCHSFELLCDGLQHWCCDFVDHIVVAQLEKVREVIIHTGDGQ